jgi:undecaprenyl-diphosphatase
VLLYFARDIARIVAAWATSLVHRERRSDPDARMGWLIIVGSIPIIVLGLALQDAIETTFRDLRIVATALVVFSVVLYVADRIGAQRQLTDLTVGHGLVFGLAQALALVPGVSRSGGTITAGRLLGYERGAAARYSFLLAVPAVLGSGCYQAYQALSGQIAGPAVQWGPTLLATVISFGVGLAVISWLLRYLSRGSFTPFVVHRIVVGVLVLVLVGTGAIPAT